MKQRNVDNHYIFTDAPTRPFSLPTGRHWTLSLHSPGIRVVEQATRHSFICRFMQICAICQRLHDINDCSWEICAFCVLITNTALAKYFGKLCYKAYIKYFVNNALCCVDRDFNVDQVLALFCSLLKYLIHLFIFVHNLISRTKF